MGRAKYKCTKTKFLPPEAPSQLPSNSLPPDNADSTSFVTFTALLPQSFHVCPIAIYPRTICIPPLCDSRGLRAPYSLPGCLIRPPLPPCWLGTSLPEHSVPLLPSTIHQRERSGRQGTDSFQKGKAPSLLQKTELQALRVAPRGTCLLKARSFLTNTPNVIAKHSRKQTHSEGQLE